MSDQHTSAAPLAESPEPARPEGPRIYVACLAAYNNGYLHGAWIDATTPDEIMEEVQSMLTASPIPQAEEWSIHDYEGFEGASLSEYASFETVCELAEFIGEHGSLAAKLFTHFGDDLEEAKAAFEDYAGEFKSAADFAEDVTRECGTDIPKSLEYYIDWEALARDMEMSGEILVIRTGFDEVHVFWQR